MAPKASGCLFSQPPHPQLVRAEAIKHNDVPTTNVIKYLDNVTRLCLQHADDLYLHNEYPRGMEAQTGLGSSRRSGLAVAPRQPSSSSSSCQLTKLLYTSPYSTPQVHCQLIEKLPGCSKWSSSNVMVASL